MSETINPVPPPAAPPSSNEALLDLISRQSRELEAIRARDSANSIDNVLTTSLASSGAEFCAGAIEQLRVLLRPSLQIVEHGGETAITGPGLVPVAEWVRSTLESEPYLKFIRAKNPQGGTAGSGSVQVGAYPPGGRHEPVETRPKNLGYAIIAQFKDNALQRQTDPSGDPKYDTSKSFGLTPLTR